MRTLVVPVPALYQENLNLCLNAAFLRYNLLSI